ncbi:hypothetical protein Bca52824_008049 [Brassica carinata]|uniref:Exosome-associated factor Rrp6 N-terminal domain-containing protein n=1 Tax=Brassica carinata TaxID=52824 RepID=A0A8X7W8I8_BRACI|nr:hypothetical protein Bca52824_008049 [Brassica carinata]
MSDGNMDVEESAEVSSKVKSLETLVVDGSSFSRNLSKLSSSSRLIPTSKDFHFYYNFDEFKRPTDEMSATSQSLLETIGDSDQVLKSIRFPGDIEEDDADDWLCNVNDEFLERFDVSVDDFQRVRKEEEEIGRTLLPPASDFEDDGFQMVYGKKKKPVIGGSVIDVKLAERDNKSLSGKAKVPFHVPTIKKPQEEFNILVNNANQPFEHVWLERSEDNQRVLHPLEKLSVIDFVGNSVSEMEPVKPLPLEETPFKLVQDVKDLKDLVAKLRTVDEFAIPKCRLENSTPSKEMTRSISAVDLCTQLYEKELLTENSYLHIYGLQAAGFNAAQLAIVAGLCEWRDYVASRRSDLIKHSIQNCAAFESAALSLKDASPGTVMENIEPLSERKDMYTRTDDVASPNLKENSLHVQNNTSGLVMVAADASERKDLGTGLFGSAKGPAAVLISKKPSSGLGALLGKAKLEQIRSSVNLQFQSFTDKSSESKSATGPSPKEPEEVSTTMPASVSKQHGATALKDDSEEASEIAGTSDRVSDAEVSCFETENVILLDDGGGKELSTNFQKCFNSMSKSNNKAQKPEFLNVEPFDYEAARKEVTFGEGQKGRQGGKKEGGSKAGGQKKGSAPEQSEFGQGKRRQAFPASGNRSATFKS